MNAPKAGQAGSSPAPASATPALPLEVTEITKVFRTKRRGPIARLARHKTPYTPKRAALDSVSFKVPDGEIYGILGANGSGKSTLIRILCTLLLPDRGQVRVFGHDVVKEASAVRPLLNRVSVDPSFFKPMSALENLLFFGRAYGLDGPEIRSKSKEILHRLGLDDDHMREPMLHLSRGQQQKVAVARAFLSSPRLMLLDEPTTGLDPRSKREVQAFITEVRRESQTTILLTTHDMDEAEQLCDRMGFLSGGRLVAEGTPLELRKQVAAGRSLEEVDMETVFLELTGRSIEEDEDEDEDNDQGKAPEAQYPELHDPGAKYSGAE
jgi:ABC-2 type transport system ATP-binding protein